MDGKLLKLRVTEILVIQVVGLKAINNYMKVKSVALRILVKT